MTARLAAYLTGSTPAENIAIQENPEGGFEPVAPSKVAERLNRIMLKEMETDLYFTMILGHFDRESGQFKMTQCGHPHPVLQRKGGDASFFGEGGMPVGLMPNSSYDDVEITLQPGDRVLLFSDGVTECPDGADGMLEEEGLLHMCENLRAQTGQSFFDTFMWDLNSFSKDQDFPDDISGILLEFNP